MLHSVLDYSTTFGANKSSFLLTFGTVVTSLHFKEITKTFDLGIPLLIGQVSSGKTSCLEVLIAGEGRVGNISSKWINLGSAGTHCFKQLFESPHK